MRKLGAWKMIGAILALCAATEIAAQAQTFTALHSFDGNDGQAPYDSLDQGADGNLYGTTNVRGYYGGGTVFTMTPTGNLTTIYNFCQPNGDDCANQPFYGLVQANNGVFYGTTPFGGSGKVFRITPNGTFGTFHNFTYSDGDEPLAPLTYAVDGSLYGTTYRGGAYGQNFCAKNNCPDGKNPTGALVQATDGHFYGTASGGGVNGDWGTVFRMTPSGREVTLHSFCDQTNCADGSGPTGLSLGIDGNLYGTTQSGGDSGYGTIFKITPQGGLTTIYSFCSLPNCPDGGGPASAPVQATDGNLYGTTSGQCCDYGTVYQITPQGVLTTLYQFCSQPSCTDGALPNGLMQATNGKFYATTSEGGVSDEGIVFSLDAGLGPFVTFLRMAGRIGQTGGILGQGFTGTTGVSLNGTPASFTVVSDTFIRATVPAGATTGYVTVTTPSGTLTSNVPFHVIK